MRLRYFATCPELVKRLASTIGDKSAGVAASCRSALLRYPAKTRKLLKTGGCDRRKPDRGDGHGEVRREHAPAAVGGAARKLRCQCPGKQRRQHRRRRERRPGVA